MDELRNVVLQDRQRIIEQLDECVQNIEHICHQVESKKYSTSFAWRVLQSTNLDERITCLQIGGKDCATQCDTLCNLFERMGMPGLLRSARMLEQTICAAHSLLDLAQTQTGRSQDHVTQPKPVLDLDEQVRSVWREMCRREDHARELYERRELTAAGALRLWVQPEYCFCVDRCKELLDVATMKHDARAMSSATSAIAYSKKLRGFLEQQAATERETEDSSEENDDDGQNDRGADA